MRAGSKYRYKVQDETPHKGKRVAVIGAGPAGLCTLKELLESGHDAVGFEMQPTLGGVFAQSYEGLQLTSSSLLTSFGSFSDGSESSPTLWSCGQYLDYLDAFARHFGLNEHIHFSTRVTSLRRCEASGRWVLRAEPMETPADRSQRGWPPAPAVGLEAEFDHVAICSGLHQVPVIPALPQQEDFGGTILHSAEFRCAQDLAGHRVLLVGLGESGSDLALQVARVAEATVLSTRSGPGYVIPRYFGGLPADLDTNRCNHAIPRWLSEKPIVRFKTTLEKLWRGPDDDRQVLRKAEEINKAREYSPFRRFGTKNTSFIEAMLYHGAECKSAVERLEPGRAVFAYGSSFECDTILCCTGFRGEFTFLAEHHPGLAEQGANSRYLYKHMLVPERGVELAWIGFVRPGIGSIPPCVEMQARYFAALVSGQLALPPIELMKRDIEAHARLDQWQFPEDALRIPALTDYLRFMESMAEVIGCQSPLRQLFLREPRIWTKVLFGPLTAVQYRLAGPGADPDRARTLLKRMPTMPWPILAYEFAFLFGSKLAYLMGLGDKHKPIGF